MCFVLSPGVAFGSGTRRWEKRTKKAREYLRKGQWEKAQLAAERTGDLIINKSLPTTDNGGYLAATARIQAVAYAELGEERLAKWYWQVAGIFEPGFVDKGILAKHPRAEYLEGVFPRSQSDPLSRLPEVEEDGLGKPKAIDWAGPQYSDRCRQAHFIATIVVDLIIGTDGSVSDPVLVRGQDAPVFSFAVLDALAHRRFEPVLANGSPIQCRYKMTVKMRLSRGSS